MEKTLANKSDFLKQKYKFFINRIVIYFSFLCIPLLIQKTVGMNLVIQSLLMLAYIVFMGSQWYLFGKEIDHRLKIYYRANSSMERIVYRLVMGSIVMMLLFNVFSLLPAFLAGYLFWGFFGSLGIFYSWPTRGKIIEESIMGQFSEISFLDSFEKTILLLCGLTFLISLPELPLFQNTEALKLHLDPSGHVNEMFWNFLQVLYYPFSEFPKLYNLTWNFHFYFVGLGIFSITFYCLLRYFFSRRLALLGVFSVLSTWSFSRILGQDYFASMTTTVGLLWIWSLMWSTRSGTYRSGLFTGLVCSYLTMINALNIVFLPIGIVFTYLVFMNNRTPWFRKQWVKYNLFGACISLSIFIFGAESLDVNFNNFDLLWENIANFIYRKAFFTIAPIGLLLALFYLAKRSRVFFTYVNFDQNKFKEVIFGTLIIIFLGTVLNPKLLSGFSLVWILSFFSLIPIEWIFQSISRLRSKRNLIYAMYIIVCLLDSHLETRFRIIGKMFLEIESLKYFITL